MISHAYAHILFPHCIYIYIFKYAHIDIYIYRKAFINVCMQHIHKTILDQAKKKTHTIATSMFKKSTETSGRHLQPPLLEVAQSEVPTLFGTVNEACTEWDFFHDRSPRHLGRRSSRSRPGLCVFFFGGGRWLGRGLEVKTFNTRSSKLIYGRFFRNGTSPFSEIGDTSSNVCLSIEMVVFTWRVTSRFTRSSNSN